MSPKKEGCLSAAAGPLGRAEPEERYSSPEPHHEEVRMIARVGHPAPDFEASALHEGEFKNVKLSDYFGQWIVLCFYPGDFTFV